MRTFIIVLVSWAQVNLIYVNGLWEALAILIIKSTLLFAIDLMLLGLSGLKCN